MEKYAVILTGGKQYRVQAGDEIFIEKLEGEADDVVTFDQVLAVADDEAKAFGAPYIEGATVTGKIIKRRRATAKGRATDSLTQRLLSKLLTLDCDLWLRSDFKGLLMDLWSASKPGVMRDMREPDAI